MSLPRGAALGLGLGAVWGVLARVWMRLISDNPEFSWAGTLAIIGLSAVLGTGVGLMHAARRSGRSGWWTLAVVPGLLLFMSPGMLLAPCFLLGGLGRGALGRVLQAVGVLAVAASVGLGVLLADGELTVVYVAGYAASAASLAWASSLAYQRRQPSTSPRAARSAPIVVSSP